ncbi:MAG: ROK family protein [Candidatus Flexifilum sp.]
MQPHTGILRCLRQAPRSLADLQADVQVSLPTLRKAVQDLAEAHWIRIVGQGETNGGRPPKIYGLDTTYYAIVGVHLQLPGIHLITTDLSGTILHERRRFDEPASQPGGALAAIIDYVHEVRAALPGRVVLGIGIASPGFIDPPSGDILMIGRVPGWENFPICTHLRAALDLPIRIANDIDCMALAELRSGGLSGDQHLVYLGFDEGVKASLFLNGALYRGALGNAGLIAGSLLRIPGADAVADPDALLSIHRVNALFDERVARQEPSERAAYAAIRAIDDPRRRFEMILASADERHPVCLEVIRLMNRVIAAAVANLILIVQPHVLVLGGALSAMPPALLADLNNQIRTCLPAMISNNLTIRPGISAANTTAAHGAVHHFLEHYLSDEPDVPLNLN